mmetsp:Transcript_36026/g.81082  ORF Transcript_36026/g.81082 Transcript_36026/m.81082 type:complete len:579 (-) Transcript_36026:285-2021(-)
MERWEKAGEVASGSSRYSLHDDTDLLDVKRSRSLPANSPFVGTFHRGHSVANSHTSRVVLLENGVEDMLCRCPYVDSPNSPLSRHSWKDALDVLEECHEEISQSDNVKGPAPIPQDSEMDCHDIEDKYLHDVSKDLSSAPTPELVPRSDRSLSLEANKFARPVNPFKAKEAGPSLRRSNRMKRQHSFTDIMDYARLPQSPELCGLQAILPKQSGVRVLDKLGEGTFAKVVLALNRTNKGDWKDSTIVRKIWKLPREGDQVVLKCVKKEEFADCQGVSIESEVDIHSRCRHPNIPMMYGYYQDGQNIIMILDYVPGKELKEIMQVKRTIAEKESCILILQVLRALAHMHSQGFVHRDVSPRNVLVTDSSRAWLIDLGLATDTKVKCSTMVASAAMGTIGYIAPECIRNSHEVSMGTDVWACGIILYEMIFGFSPFLPAELHNLDPVPFPDPSWGLECSQQVKDLIEKLLQKNPSHRITSKDAISHECFTQDIVEHVDEICGTQDMHFGMDEDVTADTAIIQEEIDPAIARKTCLAVDLLTPATLESTKGDHKNFMARVLVKSDSIEEMPELLLHEAGAE